MLRLFSSSMIAILLASAPMTILAANAQTNEKHHAMSLIGAPKYGPDFKHFDYVNPDAPKGGTVRLYGIGTFDSLNLISFKGNKASGLAYIYDQLMARSLDESSAEYGQLAEWVSYPPDFSSVTYKLRDNARWHDGKPVTPEDVIFSLTVLKANNPAYSGYYKNVTRAEKTGEHEITFHFDQKNNRELPQIVGQLVILPKHFYEGPDAAGRKPDGTWLETPLGSGPYKIKTVNAGRYIVYERVQDYWGADLPVSIGYNNFDEIRFDYFLDRLPAFEAFKAGKLDYMAESSAKSWATAYGFPAVVNKSVIKRDDIQLKNPEPMQAFVFNIRRDKFKDPRVRQAFNLVFNFEWLSQNIFYSQYQRTSSFFENTELAAKGLPQGKELEILNEVRDQVPAEVFTTEYKNPVNATPQDIRRNTREAARLLREAGYEIRNNRLVNKDTGKALEVEFLLISPDFERVVTPFKQSLERIGVTSTIRVIDASQYQRRTDNYDYDIIVDTFGQSESPGNEQRDFWGSEAADRPGSRNTIGIKNPAIDKVIERIIYAKDREELIAACQAMDRILLWNHYVVPQWFSPKERIAYWNKYSHPETLPSRSVGFPEIWWYDKEKAAKLPGNN